MDRRSFLIGSGALLTSSFVDKANWFLRNQNAVVPFREVNQTVNKICFVSISHESFELRWDTPEFDFPELTYRQWLSKYEDLSIAE
ncbi:hypothetical protein OAD38_08575, partial [Ascidiaceihabitans sp.]|nr:hypothetical protein [Ascidiaceihabitans sp.]